MCSFEANIEGKATASGSRLLPASVQATKNECILASGKSRMT